jgi:hypothetical protein
VLAQWFCSAQSWTCLHFWFLAVSVLEKQLATCVAHREQMQREQASSVV